MDKTVTLPCNFVGSFKVGDNIVYNCTILVELAAKNQEGIFNKMIVLQAAAILEACMAEIIYRAKYFTAEGVPPIDQKIIADIQSKQLDKFNHVIDAFKKHKMLDGLGEDIYKDLHWLRALRNKFHIQDSPKSYDKNVVLPKDEVDLYSDESVAWSLRLLNEVIQLLGHEYARPGSKGRYVNDVIIPQANSTA